MKGPSNGPRDSDNLIIAFDTSERNSTVLLSGHEGSKFRFSSRELSEQQGVKGKLKSTSLAGMIDKVMRDADVQETQIETIALSIGPGTFTGLRVGIVTARMLAWAWERPLIAVNSLEATANWLRLQRDLAPGQRVWSVVNAQRKQLFVAGFEVAEDSLIEFQPQKLLSRDDFLNLIQKADHVTGQGAMDLKSEIENRIEVSLPEPDQACCSADAVLALARPRILAEDYDDLWKIEPIYFRPSAAEEVRLAAEKSK